MSNIVKKLKIGTPCFYLILGVFLLHQGVYAQGNAFDSQVDASIEFLFTEGFKRETVNVTQKPYKTLLYLSEENYPKITGEIINNRVNFTFNSQKPFFVDLSEILGDRFAYSLLEPGDKVLIRMGKEKLEFSGKGSGKFSTVDNIIKKINQLPLPHTPSAYEINSFNDYLEWSRYSDRQADIVDSVTQASRLELSQLAFDYIFVDQITMIEFYRSIKFGLLIRRAKDFNVPISELYKIFDKVADDPKVQRVFNFNGVAHHYYFFYDFIRSTLRRKYAFDINAEVFAQPARKVSYMTLGKKLLTGTTLQDFMARLITDGGLKDHVRKEGGSPVIEKLLKDYYYYDADPEYAAYVKRYEDGVRAWAVLPGMPVQDFTFQDVQGKLLSKSDFNSKIILLTFYDGEKESAGLYQSMDRIAKKYSTNQSIVFLNVFRDQASIKKLSIDWKFNAKQSNVHHLSLLESSGPDVLKMWDVRAYPKLTIKAFPRAFLIDVNGNSVFYGDVSRLTRIDTSVITANDKRFESAFPYPQRDGGVALIRTLDDHVLKVDDGPYVFDEKGKKVSYYINSVDVVKSAAATLRIQTDQFGKHFQTSLQKTINIQDSESPRPEKLIALSDIEGNFDKFRLLLQNNGIIDTAYNWTFGNGHLVFCGDMFDRGKQVTECLWLIYSLEEKAKAARGQVHFILGNHEIMNLQGDHRYADEKYKRTAEKLGKTLTDLYGENSELGRWLRAKNIVEKIGDLLFVHGGLSPQINASSMTVPEMNKLARPYYTVSKTDYGDANTNLVMSQKYGPFWYRGYYDKKADVSRAVDSILSKYNAKHIITGHTIVADTISVLYGNKVINTDVKHRRGNSEALLIEGKNFYRVTYKGEKFLLFKDED